ncbi:S41 family peptidase [Bacillus salitolerans]|uniref:S41 family peptidase n=1 Tax=Bacillus salitolerans TaxID=1437434 RepID=A0ABW4LNR0_9BACI
MRKSFLLFLLLCLFISGCYSNDITNYKKEVSNEDFNNITAELTVDHLHNEDIDNLFVLGKIWGFLKYYHPNIAAGQYNFDKELMKILPEILQAKNSHERDKSLEEWIIELGEFQLLDNENNILINSKVVPDLGWIDNLNLDNHLIAKLKGVKNGRRTSTHRYVSLHRTIGNPIFNNEDSYSTMDYPSAEYRLLSLYRYWNIIEYYFPYKYLIGEDWDHVLKEFIPKFIEASDEKEYKVAVLELIARINDTHAQIASNEPALYEFMGINFAPVIVEFIENNLVITDYYDEKLGAGSGLQIGDVITKVDHKSLEELIKEKLKYISASNYPTKLRELAKNLLRTNGSTLEIEIIRDGEAKSITAKAYDPINLHLNNYNPFQKDKNYFELLSDDIGYIYTGSLKSEYLPEIKSKLEHTKGVIIDLRSYPAEFILYKLGEYFMPEPTKFSKITNGSIQTPGLFKESVELSVGNYTESYYKGKVVILVNEYTQSQAEFTAMAFQKAPRATVIGSTTAAADGNISTITLPGGIETTISGTGIYYPDGTETQRVGIVPNMTVRPTIEGVKEKRDEVLEKAIELINEER